MSRQKGRRCRQITPQRKRVCVYHGGASRGPYETNWNCRRGGLQKKLDRMGRSQWPSMPNFATPHPDTHGAHEFAAAEIDALMRSRGRA
jgi:hypothetical protein